MAIRNSVVTVGTSEVTLFDPASSGSSAVPCKVLLTPDSGNTVSVYVGATGLTADAAATGGTIIPSGGLAVDLMPGEVLKAISTAVSQKIRVLAAGA